MSLRAINNLSLDDLELSNDGYFSPHFFKYFKGTETPYNNNCVYIAMATMLAYYDLYWDDRIVPLAFENSEAVLDYDEIDVDKVPSYNLSLHYHNPNVLDEIAQYKSQYLVLALMDIGYNHFGYHNSPNEFGLNLQETKNILNYYFYSYTQLSSNDYSFEETPYESEVISSINSGVPVICFCLNESNVGHAQIAYDYDLINGLYVDTLTRGASLSFYFTTHYYSGTEYFTHHVPLDLTSFPIFFRGLSITFNYEHSHNYKYIYNDGSQDNYHCSCESIKHDKYGVAPAYHFNNYFLDTNPTLIIDDVCTAKIYGYSIIVVDYSINIIYIQTTISGNTLLFNDWSSMLNSNYNSFVMQIGRITKENNRTLNTFTSVLYVDFPLYNHDNVILDQNVLYFSPNYSTGSKQIVVNNTSINVNYCRTGFIENEVIVLSARRNNAGTAYLEFNFLKKIKCISYYVALWSDREYLYDNGSVAYLQASSQASNVNNWSNIFDLLYDYNMSIKTVSYDNLITNFTESSNIHSIRFYINTAQVGTWNKGRLCFKDINIQFYD